MGHRAAWRVALMAVGLVASGAACSLLIDVQPNCDKVSDCRPYVCNAANTACRSYCTSDGDCAAGYTCDTRVESCVSTGCVPTGPAVSLFSLSGNGLEYDAARLGETFWVVVATSEGVGLIQIGLDGTVVGGSDALEVLDPNPTLPAVPLAIATEQGVTLLWRGQPGDSQYDLRLFNHAVDGTERGPAVVYSGLRGQSLDDPAVAWLGDDLAVAWSTFLDRVSVQLLPLNLDGTFGPDRLDTAPNDAAMRLTDPSVGASLPALAATADRLALVRRESSVGSSGVVVSFLDSTFAPINDHTVSGQQAVGLDQVRSAGMATGVAVTWLETVNGTRSLVRAVDGVNGTILSGTATEDFTTNPVDPSVAAGTAEFAIAWVGQTEAGSDVFMRRFDESGGALFVTSSVSGHTATHPVRPRAVRTADGYAVFWVESGVDPAELMVRRFVCAR